MLMEYRAGPMDQLAEGGHSIDGLGMLGFPYETKMQHISANINRNSRSIQDSNKKRTIVKLSEFNIVSLPLLGME